MMTDSFFSARNQFDRQVDEFNAFAARELLEAAARRLVVLQGPIETARATYRLADICAGAHVVPIDALAPRKPKEPVPQSREPQKSRFDRAMDRVKRIPLLWFWSSLLVWWLILGR